MDGNQFSIDWGSEALRNVNIAWKCDKCNSISMKPDHCAKCNDCMTMIYRPEPTADIDMDDFTETVSELRAGFAGYLVELIMKWFKIEDAEDGWYEDLKDEIEDISVEVARLLGFPIDDKVKSTNIAPRDMDADKFNAMMEEVAKKRAIKIVDEFISAWFDVERKGPAWRDRTIVTVQKAVEAAARATGKVLGYALPGSVLVHVVEKEMFGNDGKKKKKAITLHDFIPEKSV